MSKFITFEGGEGSGKTTQAKLLVDRLQKQNIPAIFTREPGGSKGAELIRELLVTGAIDRWSVISEVLLIYAARADHWQNLIKPALDSNKWVICDRFSDSTIAYQGYGQGVDIGFLDMLYKSVIGDIKPDCTFIFDVPVELGLKRAWSRMNGKTVIEGRFESMSQAFHEKLRRGFLEIAKQNPTRCQIINGDQPLELIHKQIINHLQARHWI